MDDMTLYAMIRAKSGLLIDGEDVRVSLRGNGWQYGGTIPGLPIPEGYLDHALVMTPEMTESVEVTGTTSNSTIALYATRYSDNSVILNNVTIDKPSPAVLPPLFCLEDTVIELKGTNVFRAAGGMAELPPVAIFVEDGTCYLYGSEDGSDALFVYPGVDGYPAVMAEYYGEILIRGGTYNEYMPKEYVDADAGYVPLDNGDGTLNPIVTLERIAEDGTATEMKNDEEITFVNGRKTSISITKEWEGGEEDEIVLTLYANGNTIGTSTFRLK